MISIITVGYNNREYLDDYFSSLFQSDYKKFRVIFVDNNSSDDTVGFIEKNYPQVTIIQNKDNYGFAKANNIGIKKAIDLGSDFVFLLNPDTVIEPHCLFSLLEKADSKTIWQPLVLIYKKKKTFLINAAGIYLNFLGVAYCADYRKKAKEINKEKEIATGSGAALLIPVEVFKKISFFDERFFMYHEDVDLCWRARLAGFNIKLLPNAIVWHKYSFSRNKLKFFHVEKNRIIFLAKNFSLKYLLLVMPMLVIHEMAALAYSLINFWLWEKLKTYISIISLKKHILNERKKIQILRTTNDKNLKKYLNASVDFAEIAKPWFFSPYNFLLTIYWKVIYHLI